jgi:transglutaminase/protease-like cytokinesis protein 3
MRQIVLLLPALFFMKLSDAQGFNKVKYLNIPDSLTNTTANIAAYINSHFNGEENKVHAIYNWLIANLKYDKDSSTIINAGVDPGAKISVALKRKKGVCENFAAIFNEVCLKSGLISFVVNGYTKQSGKVDKAGHSWCAVSVDKNWYLFDPTWDVGNGISSQYFMVRPAEFITSHMPYDPLWQLLNYPISHEQFYSGNIYKKNNPDYFNYIDSVSAYIKMDSLHKLQSTALRIQNQGMYNPRIKDNYNYVKMHVEMINQDNDLDLYNSAMADLNDATTILNSFIQYRNNQFIPEKTDEELRVLLTDIDSKMDSSLYKLDRVDKSKATLVLGTDDVRERLNNLSKKILTQKAFLKQYLETPKPERKNLFY